MMSEDLQHHPDRRELQRVDGHSLEGVRVDGERVGVAGEQRVAVRPRAQHRVGAEVAAGAALVVHHHRLAERGRHAGRAGCARRKSVCPPGGKPTTIWIGRVGYWPWARRMPGAARPRAGGGKRAERGAAAD